jgi:hypothetical protein
LRTFSLPAGSAIEIFNRLVEPARLEGKLRLCAEATSVAAGVEARTAVVVSLQVPATQAIEHEAIEICRPVDELVVRALAAGAESWRVGEAPSNVPIFVRSI